MKSTIEMLIARLDKIETRNIEKDEEDSESKKSFEDFLKIMMAKQDERAAKQDEKANRRDDEAAKRAAKQEE